MKLLFAIKHLASSVGGAERVLCTICSELAKRGHEVSIVTFDQPGGKPFYELDNRVKLIDLAIGNTARPASIFETVKRMKAFRHIATTEQTDVAVGFMHSIFIPMAFALAGTGISTLGSEHIVPEHYRTRRLQFFLLVIAARLMKKITVLSEAIRSSYPASVKAKMVVMHNPIEKPIMQTDKVLSKSNRTLLNVGRLDKQKDHATLIQAFSKIAPDFPNWQLKIVGDGPLRKVLEELIEALDLQDRVALPGVTEAIDTEYASADIFVISSTYEAFGLATAEAMSHGLPTVGFADCSGTNELIENNVSGVLVEPKDGRIEDLAVALSDLIKNSALQENLGKAGQEQIKRYLSKEQICDQWEALLVASASKQF
jgi:glycosyltransferase involved in cell wall biosynthesis